MLLVRKDVKTIKKTIKVKFTSKYKIVKWTESRVSKHLLTNKNYLELFFAYFGISNRFICGKRSRQKNWGAVLQLYGLLSLTWQHKTDLSYPFFIYEDYLTEQTSGRNIGWCIPQMFKNSKWQKFGTALIRISSVPSNREEKLVLLIFWQRL